MNVADALPSDIFQQIVAGHGLGHGKESQGDAKDNEATLDGDGFNSSVTLEEMISITLQESRGLSLVEMIVIILLLRRRFENHIRRVDEYQTALRHCKFVGVHSSRRGGVVVHQPELIKPDRHVLQWAHSRQNQTS